MLNIGAGEIAMIMVVALLLLGPRRLPEMARGIGKFMREFRRQTDEVRSTLESEFYRMDRELLKDDPRFKAPPPQSVSREEMTFPSRRPGPPSPTLSPLPGQELPPDLAAADPAPDAAAAEVGVEQPEAPGDEVDDAAPGQERAS